MKTTNQSTRRDAIEKAMRIAEFRETLEATDSKHMEACVNDLVANAGLSPDEARIVAASYRADELPKIATELGIDREVVAQLLGVSGELPTADFAKDKDTDDPEMETETPEEEAAGETLGDEIEEHGHVPTPEEESVEGETPEMHTPEVADAITDTEDTNPIEPTNDFPEDLGEANDTDIATIQIEIPASEIEAVQKLLDEHFGGSSNAEDSELPVKEDAMALPAATETPLHAEETVPSHPLENPTNEVNPMTENELAARKAERAALLNSTRRVTAEDETKPKDIGLGKDTSHNGKPFQYAGDAQYKGEDTRPTHQKDDSAGNSLKEQNPKFNKQPIPTNNPDNLQLKGEYEVVKKEGSTDGSLEYTVDFKKLDNIPSGEPDRIDDYSVPTQMPEVAGARKTTVAKVVECSGCNNPSKKEVVQAECQECKQVVAICGDCEDEGYCPVCAGTVVATNGKAVEAEVTKNENGVEEESGDGPRLNIQPNGDGFLRKPHEDDETNRKANEVWKARVKTAYAVSHKLAANGVIDLDDIEANAEMWLTDGLSAATMVNQGKLLLSSAQTREERVAAAYNESRNVRTAGSSISINPALSASTQNEAPSDLKEALRGILMSKFDN